MSEWKSIFAPMPPSLDSLFGDQSIHQSINKSINQSINQNKSMVGCHSVISTNITSEQAHDTYLSAPRILVEHAPFPLAARLAGNHCEEVVVEPLLRHLLLAPELRTVKCQFVIAISRVNLK